MYNSETFKIITDNCLNFQVTLTMCIKSNINGIYKCHVYKIDMFYFIVF